MAKYTVDDGLGADEVYCTHQDSKGFLFFGTMHGLNLFDGIKFRMYSTGHGLSNPVITSIEDFNSNGELLVGTALGVYAFDGQRFYIPKELEIFKSKYVLSVKQKYPKSYMILTNDGLYNYDKNSVIKCFTLDSTNRFSNRVKMEYVDNQGGVYIRQSNKLFYIGSGKLKLISNEVLRVKVINQHTIVFCNNSNGIFTVNKGIVSNKIDCKFELPILKFDTFMVINEKSKILFKSNQVLPQNSTIFEIYEDNYGNIWINTTKGLIKYFKSPIIYEKSSGESVGRYLTALYYLNNVMYLMYNDNKIVDEFGKEDNSFSQYLDKQGITGLFGALEINGTDVLFNSGTHVFVKTPTRILEPENYFSGYISDEYTGQFGMYGPVTTHYYFCSQKRILEIEKKTKKCKSISLEGPNIKIRFLIRSIDNQLLMATNNGIWLYDKTKLSKFNEKVNGNCWHLTEKNNHYWFTNAGKGILVLDKKGNLVDSITLENGLPDNDAMGLGFDLQNRLWTLHKRQFACSDKIGNNWNVRIFDKHNGYEKAVEWQPVLPNDSGEFQLVADFGTYNIHPKYFPQFKSTSQSQYFRLIKFTVNNIPISTLNNIELEFSKNNIEIEVAVPFFSCYYRPFYQYRFKGISKGWIDAGQDGKFNFYNLSHGNYELEIRYHTGNRIWNYFSPCKWKILPPWYKTTLFYILVSVLTGAIIYSVVRYRIAMIKLQSEKERGIVEFQNKLLKSELLAFRTQMNPHLVSNILNSIQGQIIANKPYDAMNTLSNYSKYLRNVLDTTDQLFIPVSQELELLNSYVNLEKAKVSSDFEFNINIDELLAEELMIPAMLLQPIVENSLLHGFAGLKNKCVIQIDFVLNEVDNKLLINIIDNGIGFNDKINIDNSGRKSYGMSNVENRLFIVRQHSGIDCSMTREEVMHPILGRVTQIGLTLPRIRQQDLSIEQ